MGVAVLVAVWTRVKVLSSSLFAACHQFVQFPFVTVFRGLNDLKKISKLYMSWRRVRYLSVENTSIGFKMREKLRLESDSFSVSQFWTASVNMKFSIMLVFCNV